MGPETCILTSLPGIALRETLIRFCCLVGVRDLEVYWSFGKRQVNSPNVLKQRQELTLKYQALFVCVLRYYYPHFRNEEIEEQYRVAVFLEDRFLEVGLLQNV